MAVILYEMEVIILLLRKTFFRLQRSPIIFDNLSRAVCYIAEYNYNIKNILHSLDEFLTVESPNAIAEKNYGYYDDDIQQT
jgi:hypothetical protein